MCELTKNIKYECLACRKAEAPQRTQFTIQYVESEGFNVVVMWECEFNGLCQQNLTLYDKLDTQRPDFFWRHG